MILTAPDDRRFQNGPAFRKGDPVDVTELADALGRTDVDELAADLIDQGWPLRSGDGAKPSSVAEVLASVGDDPQAARAALDAELAGGSPRKSLIRKLEVVIAGDPKTDPAPAGDDTAPEGADTKEP